MKSIFISDEVAISVPDDAVVGRAEVKMPSILIVEQLRRIEKNSVLFSVNEVVMATLPATFGELKFAAAKTLVEGDRLSATIEDDAPEEMGLCYLTVGVCFEWRRHSFCEWFALPLVRRRVS